MSVRQTSSALNIARSSVGDYCQKFPIVNKKTGEIVKAEIFVAVLGASGYTYVHATYSQKQRDFILSHVQ